MEQARSLLQNNDLTSLFAACEVIDDEVENGDMKISIERGNSSIAVKAHRNDDAFLPWLTTFGISKQHKLQDALISFAKKLVR